VDIIQLPQLSGWLGQLVTLAIAVVYVWISAKSTKGKIESKANDAANNAYEKAIRAMQTHTDILGKRLDDAEKENTRQQYVIDTICSSLENKGIYITIQGGKVVHIQESNKNAKEV